MDLRSRILVLHYLGVVILVWKTITPLGTDRALLLGREDRVKPGIPSKVLQAC